MMCVYKEARVPYNLRFVTIVLMYACRRAVDHPVDGAVFKLKPQTKDIDGGKQHVTRRAGNKKINSCFPVMVK